MVFQILKNLEISKISILENFMNLQFGKFQEFPILKISKIHGRTYESRNSFITKGEEENRPNCKLFGISNGRTISKFVNFLNFNSFVNLKKSENSLIFQFR